MLGDVVSCVFGMYNVSLCVFEVYSVSVFGMCNVSLSVRDVLCVSVCLGCTMFSLSLFVKMGKPVCCFVCVCVWMCMCLLSFFLFEGGQPRVSLFVCTIHHTICAFLTYNLFLPSLHYTTQSVPSWHATCAFLTYNTRNNLCFPTMHSTTQSVLS